MDQIIQNAYLQVTISSLGGELQSIRSAGGREYLWQGDPAYWTGRSPVLFPYIGRLTEDSYRLDGKTYHMNRHGFCKISELEVLDKSTQSVTFLLHSSETTRNIYPRSFVFLLRYSLEARRLLVSAAVVSQDEKPMYFGFGGHPGFRVPLEDGLAFTDYELQFADAAEPEQIGLSDTGYVEGPNRPVALEGRRVLHLSHDLFDHDAIVLTNASKAVTLRSEKGTHGVTVSYPKMNYIGFWHKPQTDAPYVCIEPWSSLPSRQGVVEDLETQPGLIALPAFGIYQNTWTAEMF